MDIWDKSKRSTIMAKVGQKNTKPELIVRKFLFSKGLRYRINVKHLPGSPDIVLPKYKTVVFVHGCFWHGHSCRKGRLPQTNIDFWSTKIRMNKERDDRIITELRQKGWNVLVIWQCEIDNREKQEATLPCVLQKILVNSRK